MNEVTPGELLAGEDADWTRLVAMLDAAGDRPLHGNADDAWDARGTWAHLARWFAHATAYITAYRAGQVPVSITDPDAANRDWRAEDALVPREDARARAHLARERLRTTVEPLRPQEWDEVVRGVFETNTTAHYAEHVGYAATGS